MKVKQNKRQSDRRKCWWEWETLVLSRAKTCLSNVLACTSFCVLSSAHPFILLLLNLLPHHPRFHPPCVSMLLLSEETAGAVEDLRQVRLGHRIDLRVLSSRSDTVFLGKRNYKGDLFIFSWPFLLDSSEIKRQTNWDFFFKSAWNSIHFTSI